MARAVQAHNVAISAWRIVFLLWGLVTVAAGVAFILVMPDSRLKPRFLKNGEKRLAIVRILQNQQGHYSSMRSQAAINIKLLC